MNSTRARARVAGVLYLLMGVTAAFGVMYIPAAFAETDLRNAHMIARRLSAVMRHTSHGKRDMRSEPLVTAATLLPNDSAKSLLARLTDNAQRAAS